MKKLFLLLLAFGTLPMMRAQDPQPKREPLDIAPGETPNTKLEGLSSVKVLTSTDPRAKLRTSLFDLEAEYLQAIEAGVNPVDFKSSQTLVLTQGNMVRIQAVAQSDGTSLIAELERLGATQFDKFQRVINAWYPIAKISQLPALGELKSVKPVYRVAPDIGAADSEGDSALAALAARRNYCVNGAGVRVGVISDSYTSAFPGGAAAGVASGDIPGVGNPNGFLTPVTVVNEGPPGIDEGRAMIEIVHDLAPGAQLFFNTSSGGEATYATAILNLANVSNCDIIVDDVRYLEEPFYMDGLIAQACDAVFAGGVPYFASAGNYGTSSYESGYRDSGGASNAHDFDPGAGVDTLQSITVNGGSTINFTLQWDDPWGSITPNSADTDLDVRLFNSGGTNVASSTDFNIITGDPTEFFSYTAPAGGPQTFRILITRFSGPAPAVLKWVIRNASGLVINEYPPTTVNALATGYGHSNANGANAIAAAFWGNTPAYGVNPPQPEGFTSNGGVQIRYNTNGVPITPVTRNKPNFCAVDGTSNTFFGSGNNFFGTSAAAPHAAAVAALMLEANSSLSPTDVRNLLVGSSIDMLTAGFDFTTGSGLIQADVAVREAIEQSCNITGITVVDPPICTGNSYRVTLKISYTSPPGCDDVLWVNGQQFNVLGATSQDVILTGLPTTGLPVSVTAYFVSAPGCSGSVTNLFTAPAKPTITCPSTQSVDLDENCSAAVPNYTGLGAVSTQDPPATVTQSPLIGSTVSGIGSFTVTLTVTDDCGSSTCTFSVTKLDKIPPVIVCPVNKIECTDPETNKWTAEDMEPLTLTDNCVTVSLAYKIGNVAYSPGNANGRIFNPGTTTVTYRATDGSNNTSTCSFTVTVRKTPKAYWHQTAITICNGAGVNLGSYARDVWSAAKRYNFYEGDAGGGNLQFLGVVTATNGSVNFGQNRWVNPAGNNNGPTTRYYYVLGINTFPNGPNCTGPLSGPLTVTINPVPSLTGVVVMPAGQICPGNAVSVNFSSSLPGSGFNWSNSNTGIGLAASGNGNINFVAAAAGASTLTAQAYKANCVSAPVQTPLAVSTCSQSRMFGAGEDPFKGAGAPQLFPNPTNGQLFLRLPESNSPALYATRMEFFDAAGRRVWSETFELAGGAERRIDLNRLPAGVYGWTLRVGDAGYSGRVVKD